MSDVGELLLGSETLGLRMLSVIKEPVHTEFVQGSKDKQAASSTEEKKEAEGASSETAAVPHDPTVPDIRCACDW